MRRLHRGRRRDELGAAVAGNAAALASRPVGPTRRQLVLLAASALATILAGRRTLAGPADQGIGGTGFSLRPADEDSDRGIGGTGVIGTIRKFGSIVVNDLRIAYPQDVTVRIDDRPASAGDLKLGQVVRVVASTGANGGLSTHVIDVSNEVVGRIDRVSGKTLTVLGQTVSTAALTGAKPWREGDHVAVSGLRRNDGTIAASLIQPADPALSRVVGPVVTAPDGSTRIGGLKLSGVDGTLIGQRTVVEGRSVGPTLAVTRSVSETSLLPSDVRALSVEAYVERRGQSLHLGSGLAVGGSTDALPASRPVRAVLTTTVARDGQVSVATVRANGTSYPATDRTNTAPDRPSGSRPTDLGRENRSLNNGDGRLPGDTARPRLFGPSASPPASPGPGAGGQGFGGSGNGSAPGGIGGGGFGPRGGPGGGGRH